MDATLNINGLFRDAQELSEVIIRRKICYDTEPYYIAGPKGSLVQIGYQLNLYATFTPVMHEATPDSPEYRTAGHDVRRVAEALSNTCTPIHMCESMIVEEGTLTYSGDRGMRPDVTVHIPIFDQGRFGHPVDENITRTLHEAEALLQGAGVKKKRWLD
jgi:hypothetical protein